MNQRTILLSGQSLLGLVLASLMITACANLPFTLPGAPTSALPPNVLLYDNIPVSLTIKTGTLLSGTFIAYQGKSETGQAKVIIAGLLAPKQIADTLDWQGTPAPNVNLRLSTRVAAFDEQSITLAGTARIELTNVSVQPGGISGPAQLEFKAPVSYTLKKDDQIPGTKLSYAGSSLEGAQFSGLEGYAFRKQFDSLQYVGRLTPKVFMQLDLRVLNFSNTEAIVGGTSNIKIEQ
jgi:hypothetical protein